MLKKFVILLFCVCLLCGCSQKKSAEIIEFASWGSVTEVGVLKRIISDFEAENPNIKVNFMHIPQNYFQKIHLLFASNTPPDVIFINNLYLPIYANRLLDVSNFVNIEDYQKQAIEGLSYGNKLLAIPRDISSLVLYVNNDLVEKLPENFDINSLLAIAQQTTNKKVYGISFEPDVYYLQPYLSYFGEEFSQDFIPEKSKAYKFYKDLRDVYKVAPRQSDVGSSTLAQMFLDKKIAMYLSGRWMFPKISEKALFNWQIVSFPVGKKPLPSDASGWAISKTSNHKEASLKFVQYLSSEKSSEYFTNTGLIVPARIKVLRLLDTDNHNEKEFVKVINNSKSTGKFLNYKKMVDKINLRILE